VVTLIFAFLQPRADLGDNSEKLVVRSGQMLFAIQSKSSHSWDPLIVPNSQKQY